MPYSAEISRSNPTLFLFLLDQSGSMSDMFGAGDARLRKADTLADVVNRTLHDLVIRCTKAEEVRGYYDVAVLGYGASTGLPVSSALGGGGEAIKKIGDIADHPLRLENRTRKVPDGAGGLVEQVVRFPIRVEPQAGNGTPMCGALTEARNLVSSWLAEHSRSFPPAVLHITDGESGDGEPTNAGLSISQLASSDGNVLVFNCHLSSARVAAIEYPSSPDTLPNDFAKTLFAMSSVIPDAFRRSAAQSGVTVAEGARGFVFNADPTALIQFFDIGTRPANLR
jgi:hypothetical protein